MAKDIHVQGIDLDDVPAIDIPLQTSGTARFYDCTGTKSITQNGSGIDVKGYAAVDVNVSGGGGGTYQTKSVTPSESAQVVTADAGYDALEEVDVAAISSTYVGSGITRRDSDDLTVSGRTVTAPAGYYQSQETKSVAQGTVTAPSSISGTSATVSTGTNTLTLSKTVSVTPTVSTAGYVSSGTAGNSSVSLTANVTTQGAQTIHPSTSDQTIAASRYLTGAQTIKAVTTSNLTAANVKKGVTVTVGDSSDADRILSVTGTYEGSGGGGGEPDLLATYAVGAYSTSSTQATNMNKSFTVKDIDDYDLLIVQTSVDSVINNRHTATTKLIWLTASSDVSTKNGSQIATATWNSKASSTGVTTTRSNTTNYGIYAYSCSVSDGDATIALYSRYNSTQTGTINGSYTTRVYGLSVYDLIGG